MLHQHRDRFLLVSRNSQPHDGHRPTRVKPPEVRSSTARGISRWRMTAVPEPAISKVSTPSRAEWGEGGHIIRIPIDGDRSSLTMALKVGGLVTEMHAHWRVQS